MDELKADRDKRLAAEQKKAAEEKAAAAEQAKKTKKIAMIAAPIVVVAIVAAVLISNFVKAQQEEAARLEAYNAAVTFLEEGKYVNAAVAFERLGDYRNSSELLNEANYQRAVSLLEDEHYDEAVAKFTELGNYKDSAEQAENSKVYVTAYENAVAFAKDGDYESAGEIFAGLGDYKNSAEWLTQIELWKQCTPFTGEFICMVEGYEGHLTSNFEISDSNVCWEAIFTGYGLGLGHTRETIHEFFSDNLPVSIEMTVTDKWYGETLTAKFENGDIFITGEGPFTSENEVFNRHYTKIK